MQKTRKLRFTLMVGNLVLDLNELSPFDYDDVELVEQEIDRILDRMASLETKRMRGQQVVDIDLRLANLRQRQDDLGTWLEWAYERQREEQQQWEAQYGLPDYE